MAPINLFCGVNNSGKSSLIQALLVLKQTLASPLADEPVIFNGPLVALGNYQDIHHFGASKAEPLELGVTVSFPSQKRLGAWWGDLERRFGSKLRRTGMWASRAHRRSWEPDDNAYDIDFNLAVVRDRATRGNHILQTVQLEIQPKELDWFPSFRLRLDRDPDLLSKLRSQYQIEDAPLLFRESVYAVTKCEPVANPFVAPVACMLKNFMPWSALAVDPSSAMEMTHQFLESLVPDTVAEVAYLRQRGFRPRARLDDLSSGDGIDQLIWSAMQRYPHSIRELMIQQLRGAEIAELREKLNQVTDRPSLIAKRLRLSISGHNDSDGHLDLDDTLEDFHEFFTQNLYYLGPLRDEPRAFYRRIGSADPMYVGERGENTAFVLKYYGDRDVAFVRPPDQGTWDSASLEVTMKPLIQAVVSWLKYLGVAKDIKVQDIGKIGLAIQANVFGGSNYSDLTNVGVGVSQVLPLVVLGLVCPPGSTLLLEQPELHLHPYVQSRLADFFLSLKAVGKQVIAETHSEHMIYRMRYFMAKGDINTSDLTVFFTSLSSDDTSTIRRIHINPYGEIDDWPEGFFDETNKLLDSIVDASFDRLGRGGTAE